MKYIYITFLLLLNMNLTYSQVAKVKLEGGEDKASSEISDLEKRKTELTAAQRDFETGRDLLSEYYDLSFKAYETGDATYVDQAIAKLNDSKKMIELSQQKWNAYHKLNNTFKSPTQENDYNDFLRNVNELIDRSKLLKTSCCGPDIVKLHLVPQNVVQYEPNPSNNIKGDNDFWVTGFDGSKMGLYYFSVGGKFVDFNKLEFKWLASYSGETFKAYSQEINTRANMSLYLVFTTKEANVEDVYCQLISCYNVDQDCERCCIEDKIYVNSIDSYVNFLENGFSKCSFEYFVGGMEYPGQSGKSIYVKYGDLKEYYEDYPERWAIQYSKNDQPVKFIVENYKVEEKFVTQEHELILNMLKKGRLIDESDLWRKFKQRREKAGENFYEELAWLVQLNIYKQLF